MTPRSSSWMSGVGAVALLLASASCGGDDASVTSDRTVPPAQEGTPIPDGTTTTIEGRGRSALLTVEDLPEGWRAAKVDAGDLASDGGTCLDQLLDVGGVFDPARAEVAAFTGTALGPVLAASIVDGPGGEIVAEVDDVIVGCQDIPGTEVAPAEVAAMPDLGFAISIVDQIGSDGPLRTTIAGYDDGDAALFVLVVHAFDGELDTSVVGEALSRMVDRR